MYPRQIPGGSRTQSGAREAGRGGNPQRHRGVLEIRGRRDFGRFDPSPGEAPHFSKSGPPPSRARGAVER